MKFKEAIEDFKGKAIKAGYSKIESSLLAIKINKQCSCKRANFIDGADLVRSFKPWSMTKENFKFWNTIDNKIVEVTK